jgi:hypothetical protein
VDAGADVYKADDRGRTALMCAVESGVCDIVSYLLSIGVDVNAITRSPNGCDSALSMASDPSIVGMLLEAKAELSLDGSHSVLRGASSRFRHESVKMLLQAGSKPGKTERILEDVIKEPCPYERIQDKVTTVKYLLNARASTRVISESAMQMCATMRETGISRVAELIHKHDPDLVNFRFRAKTPLMCAVSEANTEMVSFL